MELAIRGSGARDPGDSTYFTVPVPPKVAPKETILLAQVRVVPSNTHHHAPWPTYGVEALATRLRSVAELVAINLKLNQYGFIDIELVSQSHTLYAHYNAINTL